MADFPFTRLLLMAAALGSGVIGGTFFAFSTFIMASLSELSADSGIATMNAINRVILRSWFMPVFFVTALLAAILLVVAIRHWHPATSSLIIVGAALFLLASFASTVIFNVPLNDKLALMDGKSAESVVFWSLYLRDWTLWNHVRTAASLLASGAFIWAIR